MNTEKVSVIIPTFNSATTLAEAVNSVLQGTYENVEILIADDASTDDTEKIVADWLQRESRIRYYRNKRNLGVSGTRNLMIEQARGKYIAFLDSDDTWEPTKLEVCLEILRENPDIKASGHALCYLNKQGQRQSYIPTYPTNQDELKAIREGEELPWVFPSGIVIERAVFLTEPGFREDWDVGEDTELFARIAQKYGLLATKLPLGNYRLRANSLTEKYWLRKRLALDCVRENYRRRQRGEGELSPKEYENLYFNNLPLFVKLNKFRQLFALHCRRKLGQSWLNREVIPLIFYGMATTLLNPKGSLEKIQWIKYHERLSKSIS